MSTSLLYHAYGLKSVKYKATHYQRGKIIFEAEMTRKLARCPRCRSRDVIYKGVKIRKLRMPSVGRRLVWLHLLLHRLLCNRCGAVLWPRLPFAAARVSYTSAFERYTLDLLKWTTIKAAALLLGASWDLIKEIHRSALSKRYKRISLKELRYLGIDEFSIKKGRKYMTIFVDLRQGRIIHAVEGNSGEEIAPFLKILARRARKLKAVAVDLNRGYFWALKEFLPWVDVVADHYHISALVNKAIDEFRRQHQTDLDKAGLKALKGSRFLLLKNYDDLSEEKRERLDRLLEINQPLFVMHTMKEQLRHLWNLRKYHRAREYLGVWCLEAMRSGIKQLIRVAKTLSAHRSLILNYFEHRISSGKVEGINNKIKTLKRQAYGFRDVEYFKLRLYHLHEQRYSISG
jgi:transposase